MWAMASAGFKGFLAGALHIQKYLAIGKTILEPFGQDQCQSGFANAAHATQAGDGRSALEIFQEDLNLFFAACKVSWVGAGSDVGPAA